MIRPPRLRSLRNKLALLFFGITAAAFAVIYFYVVPQLRSNLEDRKLDDLNRSAAAARPTLERLMGRRAITAGELDRRVRAVADSTGARVTLLGVQQSISATPTRPVRFFVITDSREEREVPGNEELTDRAVTSRHLQRGIGSLGGDQLGQIAQPLTYRGRIDWVALYSDSLEDVS
jgi:hypothetical protein